MKNAFIIALVSLFCIAVYGFESKPGWMDSLSSVKAKFFAPPIPWWDTADFHESSIVENSAQFIFPGNASPYRLSVDQGKLDFYERYKTQPFSLKRSKWKIVILTSFSPEFRSKDLLHPKSERPKLLHQKYLSELSDYLASLKYFLKHNGLADRVETSLVYVNREIMKQWIPGYGNPISRGSTKGERLLGHSCGYMFHRCVDNVVSAPIPDFRYRGLSLYMASQNVMNNHNAFRRIKHKLLQENDTVETPYLPAVFVLSDSNAIKSVNYRGSWISASQRNTHYARREHVVSLSRTVQPIIQGLDLANVNFDGLDGQHDPKILPSGISPSAMEKSIANLHETRMAMLSLAKTYSDGGIDRQVKKLTNTYNAVKEEYRHAK